MTTGISVAVLIPCYNEAQTIAAVVRDCKAMLPDSTIYVCDNHSDDNTAAEAARAGAIVYFEPRRGKGNGVRRLFRAIEADVYLMLDGDNTYDIKSAPALITKLVDEKLDMVVGTRKAISSKSYPRGHRLGNWLFNWGIRTVFGQQFEDIFSGYRVFSRRFVKTFPCLSNGFEIETEMSVHALEMNLPVEEIQTPYAERPAGSVSKLKTFSDGFKILLTIIRLIKEVKPLTLFTGLGLLFMGVSLGLSFPIFATYLASGLVPRFPTAILSASLMLLSFMSFFSGFILDSVSRSRLQSKRLLYLACGLKEVK